MRRLLRSVTWNGGLRAAETTRHSAMNSGETPYRHIHSSPTHFPDMSHPILPIYQNLIRARLLPVLLVLSLILHSTAETSASSCTEPERAACARNTLQGARSLSMRSCGLGLGTSSAQIPSPRLVAHCGGGPNVAPGGILMTHVMGDSMSASASIAATWASSDAVSVSSAGEVMASPPLCPQSSPIRDSTISISHHLQMHLERASM